MNKLQNYVENLNGMIRQSQSEFRLYEKDHNPLFLQQAGEKLFNAVYSYITLRTGIEIEGFQHATKVATDKSDVKLLYDARELHRYFYNFREQYPIEKDAVDQYNKVIKRLKEKIRKNLIGRYKIDKSVL